MHRLAVCLIALCVSGCAAVHFERTQPGTLKGKLIVQWIDPDKFIFVPTKTILLHSVVTMAIRLRPAICIQTAAPFLGRCGHSEATRLGLRPGVYCPRLAI